MNNSNSSLPGYVLSGTLAGTLLLLCAGPLTAHAADAESRAMEALLVKHEFCGQ